MIQDPIRSAFEHIDEEASDGFRDALHARLLAELVGHDTSGQDEPNDVVTHMSGDTQSTSGRRWLITVAAAAIVLMLLGALMFVTRDDASEPEVPAAPPGDPAAVSGLIAFSGGTGESRAGSDTEIYVVAPDGTGLRALTSTPGVPEVAPVWSPDGTRLAFLRNEREGGVELVVIDPATGEETFSVDLPIPPPSHVTVPPKWSPDGRLIVVPVHAPLDDLAVDLETGSWTTFPGSSRGWSPSGTMSPDGKWFLTPREGDVVPDRLFLVPADLIGTISDFDDITQLPGVRRLVERDGFASRVTWMPDSSAVAISLNDGSTDIVTIADGQRRTLIEDGFASSWSPDGSHIAYLRCPDVPDPVDKPRDTVEADLAGVDPRQPGASVLVAAAGGTGARAVATSLVPPMWSPDGSLLIVGDDGLFTVRPDGTGMTRLTRVMTPKKEGAYAGITACDGKFSGDGNPWLAVAGWFGPVLQPMSPSADVGTAAANTDATATVLVTTEASATTNE